MIIISLQFCVEPRYSMENYHTIPRRQDVDGFWRRRDDWEVWLLCFTAEFGRWAWHKAASKWCWRCTNFLQGQQCFQESSCQSTQGYYRGCEEHSMIFRQKIKTGSADQIQNFIVQRVFSNLLNEQSVFEFCTLEILAQRISCSQEMETSISYYQVHSDRFMVDFASRRIGKIVDVNRGTIWLMSVCSVAIGPFRICFQSWWYATWQLKFLNTCVLGLLCLVNEVYTICISLDTIRKVRHCLISILPEIFWSIQYWLYYRMYSYEMV